MARIHGHSKSLLNEEKHGDFTLSLAEISVGVGFDKG
jgi:hypothetical protein